MGKLESLNIYSLTTGQAVPLKQVADIEVAWEPSKILRYDLLRTVTVSCYLEPGFTATEITGDAVDRRADALPLAVLEAIEVLVAVESVDDALAVHGDLPEPAAARRQSGPTCSRAATADPVDTHGVRHAVSVDVDRPCLQAARIRQPPSAREVGHRLVALDREHRATAGVDVDRLAAELRPLLRVENRRGDYREEDSESVGELHRSFSWSGS